MASNLSFFFSLFTINLGIEFRIFFLGAVRADGMGEIQVGMTF
jgi:hypothetical protein